MTIVGHTSDSKAQAHRFVSDDGIYCRVCNLPEGNVRHVPNPSIYPDCGTYAARQRHTREHTAPCDPCKVAQNLYVREWRIANHKTWQRDLSHTELGYTLTNLGSGRYRLYLGSGAGVGDITKSDDGWIAEPAHDRRYKWCAPTRKEVLEALLCYLEARPYVWRAA